MLTLLKSKMALAIIGVVAAGTITTTAAVASVNHEGPFATHTISAAQGHGTPDAKSTDTAKATFHAQGQITAVQFAASSTTAGILTFVPDGQSKTITVAFTDQTKVEVSLTHTNPAKGGQGNTATPNPIHGQPGAAALVAGLFAVIDGTTQTDGSVLATHIQANDHGNAHQGGPDASPTPGPSHGKGTPGPDKTPQPEGTPQPGQGH